MTIETLLIAKGSFELKSQVNATINLVPESKAEGYYFEISAKASVQHLHLNFVAEIIDEAHERWQVSKLLIGAKNIH